MDSWLEGILATAAPEPSGVALVALGSYGRAERCPHSDLDLLLLHRGRRDISAVAERVWYPIWDAGARLDHSVRTVAECTKVAVGDLRAALGLLDARLVAGDPEPFRDLVYQVRRMWEDRAASLLPKLAAAVAERHEREGEVAFLLEPDLKEGRGGLRDVQAIRAAVLARPSLGPLAPELTTAAAVLLAVRDGLHRRAGRPLDRLLLQEQDGVAAEVGYADADALMAAVASAARTVAFTGDRVWHRITRPERSRGRPRTLSPDVELAAGQVVITASVATAEVVLRAAVHAAELETPLAELPPMTRPDVPWSAGTRDELIRLLAAGRSAIPVLEMLDQTGVLVTLLPEWDLVRNRPQRNAYHRFTVDRHLCETAANAAALTRRVRRPDLLLVGAWLHDLGKGVVGRDHTDAGVELISRIGPRMAFPDSDVGILELMVRHHLTLASAATRRDIDDPATIESVASALGSTELVDLMQALTEADGLATGPAAWTPWKAELVSALADRVRRRLAGEPVETPAWSPSGPLEAGVDIGPVVRVVAADRPRLLADVTGALAASGLSVRAARVATVEGTAVDEFEVEPAMGDWPEPERVRSRIEAAVAGSLPLEGLLAERRRRYRRLPIRRAAPPEVRFDQGSTASIIEIRASDSEGLLYRLAAALAGLGVDVVQVRASTLGHEAVDTFYVHGLDLGRRQEVEQALTAAAEESAP